MGKYDPLGRFLADATGTEVPLTFGEIERITGFPLPASKRYPAWWSNNPDNNVMTRAWLDAGFLTEQVDIGGERLVFRRAGKARRLETRPVGEGPGVMARLQARLGGSVTIAQGVDLTLPTGDVWQAER